MKVFITGGTGLVGRHVIEQLIARGDTVRALARSETARAALAAAGAEPVIGDITDPVVLERAAQGVDAVIHAAAIVLEQREWLHYHALNVTPTERLATACAASGARLIHVSSVAVYGRKSTYDGGAGSVTEEFGLDKPLFPGDHYARSKREAEQALWRIAGATGLRAVALRPCVIYGAGDRQFTVRAARMLRLGLAPLVGDGSNALAAVYAGNVAAGVTAALDRPHVTGAFNLTNDGGITARRFLERFAAGLSITLTMVRIPRRLAWGAGTAADALLRAIRPGMPMATIKAAVQFLGNENPYTSAKAVRELGWTPVLAPDEAVERTARWFAERA